MTSKQALFLPCVQGLIKEHMERAERICSHLPDWWRTGNKPSS